MSAIGSLADQPLAGSAAVIGNGTNWVERRQSSAYALVMQAHALVRRSLKICAALSAVLVVILSLGAALISQSMLANPFSRLRWAIALTVVPMVAVGLFIRGTLLERRSFNLSATYYLLAISMTFVWVLLTRG